MTTSTMTTANGKEKVTEPRRPWRWERSRAWWVPAGDWADGLGLVVLKRGRDPKWYARAKRVGCVAATDTAGQAKVALETWVTSLADDPPAKERWDATLLGALRSGRWFRRRAWRDQGSWTEYQLRGGTELWARSVPNTDGRVEDYRAGRHVPFGLSEILATDWETVG